MSNHRFILFVYNKVNKSAVYRFYKICKRKAVLIVEFLQANILHDRRYVRVKPTFFWWINSEHFSGFAPFRLLGKKVFVTEKHPQIQLCSVFGPRADIRRIKGSKIFFYSGEELSHNYASYSDYLLDIADFSSGFQYEDEFSTQKQKKYLRYPLWLCYNPEFLFTDKDVIKANIDIFEKERFKNKKSAFCTLIASHDKFSGGIRRQLFDAVSKIGTVNCPSKFLHNDDSLKTEFNDNKLEYLKQFRFTICAENYSARGYVTEKLFDAFRTGTIPIYYGGGDALVEPEVVNQSAIIRYDGNNINEIIQKIRFLESDSLAFNEFVKAPVFKPDAVDWIYERNIKMKLKMESLLEA